MKILTLPPEEWKIVPRLPQPFDDEFEMSNYGRLRRIRDGKLFKGGRKGREGWKRYQIKVKPHGGKCDVVTASVYPHRMVWELFGNRTLLPHEHLYHINKCQDDNYIWNLAPTNKRWHKRRVARWKREGKYYHKRGRRYFHDRN